jgi:hypothetical protein
MCGIRLKDAVSPASTTSDFDLELALKLSLDESKQDDPLGASRHEGCDKAELPTRDALPKLLLDAARDAKIEKRLLAAARPSDLVSELGKSRFSLRRLARRARFGGQAAARSAASRSAAESAVGVGEAPPSPSTPASPINAASHEPGGGLGLLSQRLASMSLVELPMGDDGNCQFRAFSHCLFGTQEHHGVVRAACVQHMRSRSDEIAQLVGEGDELERYLCSQEKYKTWGDELTLKYTADAFDVDVHVVTSTELNWYLHYYPEAGGSGASGETAKGLYGSSGAGGRGGKRKQVFLSYIAPVHYNAIRLPASDEGS